MSNEHTTPEDPAVINTVAEVGFGLDQADDVSMPSLEAKVEEAETPAAQAERAVEPTTPAPTGAPTDDAPGATEEELAAVRRRGKNPNTEITTWPSKPLPPKRANDPYIAITHSTHEELDVAMKNFRRIDPTGSEAGRHWLDTFRAGREVMPRNDGVLDALRDPDAEWRQSVLMDGPGSQQLAAGRRRPTDHIGDATLSGEDAILRLNDALGTGQTVTVPLFGTGIWIDIKPPPLKHLHNLETRISREKIDLGRMTSGLIFSNTSVYHSSFLLNFALAYVFDSSVSDFTAEKLKKTIRLTDLPHLLWGLLLTIFPDGYRYHRPCINDPSVCTYVADELLDISKLAWYSNRRLTRKQRDLMVRRKSKFTDIELQRYQEEHRFNEKRMITLKDDGNGRSVVAQLRVPTLADYEESGFSWIESIVTETDQSFGSQLDDGERNEYIMEQAQVTALRQYAHWIERLVINGKQTIEDRKTLEETIALLTNDPDVSEPFFEGIKNFINDASVATIAIPIYRCPSCDMNQQDEEGEKRHPHLIPLDIATVFFILLAQRTQGAQARAVL